MNQDALAQAVYVSESLVRAWETGRRVPQPEHLAKLDEPFQTNGYLSRLREDLVQNERLPEYMGRWREIESQATTLLTYEPLLIPGLLQTSDYAREVIRASGRQIDDIEEHINERLERQKVLAPEGGMMFVAILDEGVLHRQIGSAETMREQLQHVLTVADQPNAIIHVVPTGVGAYPGLAGGFVVASMDGSEFVYVDDAYSGDVIENHDEVATMKRVWETLRAEALPARQSYELIEKAMEQWTTSVS